MDDRERLEKLARHVASTIPDGARLGLGSGSTAEAIIRAIGERVRTGGSFSGVATSHRTAELARAVGIELVDFDQVDQLEIGIDGADEISPNLDLVKGRGGALLHEKLVALACRRFIIVAASEKLVDFLGTRLPLPVEIVPFGWRQTAQRIQALGFEPSLRRTVSGKPFVSDGGHFIVDTVTGPIPNPTELDYALKQVPGVIDHGLFVGLAGEAIVIDETGQLFSLTPRGKAPIGP